MPAGPHRRRPQCRSGRFAARGCHRRSHRAQNIASEGCCFAPGPVSHRVRPERLIRCLEGSAIRDLPERMGGWQETAKAYDEVKSRNCDRVHRRNVSQRGVLWSPPNTDLARKHDRVETSTNAGHHEVGQAGASACISAPYAASAKARVRAAARWRGALRLRAATPSSASSRSGAASADRYSCPSRCGTSSRTIPASDKARRQLGSRAAVLHALRGTDRSRIRLAE